MKIRIPYIDLYIVLIFIVLTLPFPPKVFCKSTKNAESFLHEADQCRKSLSGSAERKKFRHNWLRCIDRYKDIYTRYPKSDQAAWAIYHSARLYTGLYIYSGRSKDLEEALNLHRRLVAEYTSHRLADDAQYLIGTI